MALRYSEARKGGALMIRNFLTDLIGAICLFAAYVAALYVLHGAGWM